MSVYVRTRFEVDPWQHIAFRRQAEPLREAALAQAGTRSYRWFSRAASDTWYTIEEYVDAASALSHLRNTAQLRGDLKEISRIAKTEIYGSVTCDLLSFARHHSRVLAYPEFIGIREGYGHAADRRTRQS